jgi:hypothetical protein
MIESSLFKLHLQVIHKWIISIAMEIYVKSESLKVNTECSCDSIIDSISNDNDEKFSIECKFYTEGLAKTDLNKKWTSHAQLDTEIRSFLWISTGIWCLIDRRKLEQFIEKTWKFASCFCSKSEWNVNEIRLMIFDFFRLVGFNQNFHKQPVIKHSAKRIQNSPKINFKIQWENFPSGNFRKLREIYWNFFSNSILQFAGNNAWIFTAIFKAGDGLWEVLKLNDCLSL